MPPHLALQATEDQLTPEYKEERDQLIADIKRGLIPEKNGTAHCPVQSLVSPVILRLYNLILRPPFTFSVRKQLEGGHSQQSSIEVGGTLTDLFLQTPHVH